VYNSYTPLCNCSLLKSIQTHLGLKIGLMKTTLILLILAFSIFTQAFADDRPEYGILDLNFSRRDLFFIAAQNKSLVGLEFISKSNDEQRYLFEEIQNVPEFSALFPTKSFKAFANSMETASKILPRGAGSADKTDETLVREAFTYKKLLKYMSVKLNSFQQSLGRIQLDDYKRNVDHVEMMALSICDGSFLIKNKAFNALASINPDGLSLLSSGKNCEEVVTKDIMEIINPYRDIDRSNNLIFTSSIYLVSKIFPSRNFATSKMFAAFERLQNVSELNPKLNLMNALGREVGYLSNIELIRLINMADTNYGTSFFSLNAIIDFSEDLAQAERNVRIFRNFHYKFYWLVDKHLKARRKIKDTPYVETLTRPYHYWAGTFITCELMDRGYSPLVAQSISTALGVVYEARTMGRATMDQMIKDFGHDVKQLDFEFPTVRKTHYNSVDDSLMQAFGANYGRQVCSGK